MQNQLSFQNRRTLQLATKQSNYSALREVVQEITGNGDFQEEHLAYVSN